MLDKVKANDTLERAESEDNLDAAEAEAPSQRGRLRHRFAPQRLTSRIVLLNLMGLVILVAGILYFNQFRQGLIDARVQSLTTQAHIIAAAVAGSATVDTRHPNRVAGARSPFPELRLLKLPSTGNRRRTASRWSRNCRPPA
jgi:hypothetical protein